MGFLKGVTLALLLVLAACAKPPSAAAVLAERGSRELRPADSELASIYDRSCRSCHTVAATGAPLTGDKASWAPRLGQGLDVMVDSVINGSGGMPPFGLCMDCDVEQFEGLIKFMAGEQ
ncbi:MAG: cytochrome c5 [Halioglobus sp.]|jgi:cytochrome c5